MDLRLSNIFILLFGAVFFTGCVALTGHRELLVEFDKTLNSGSCDYSFIDKKIEDKDDLILWASQGGSFSRNCYDYNKSNNLFDLAEGLYKSDVDLQSTAEKVGNSTNSILVNNNINSYQGSMYEKIMLNIYKGLNFMALDNFEDARVEFNRAIDRQRRAKEYFSNEITQLKSKQRANQNYQVAQNRYTQKAIYDSYRELFNSYKAYPDFVNPFTTYMSGLFFLFDGDYNKAKDLLRDAMSMEPNNTQIEEDFKLADKLSGFEKRKTHYAWVIYENGKSMVKIEKNINIPLFIFTNKVYYAGLSLPTLSPRSSSYNYIEVENKKSKIVANMDNIIEAEFEKRFPQIAFEATLNLIMKTYTQYELNRSGGAIGGLVGAIYQGLTNRADVRSWTALPKNFQVVRFELKTNNVIIKDDKNRVLSTVMVDRNKDALIYIKSSKRGIIRVHRTIKGKR